jgi:UDP-GlcNAc:undecaprenyl-phosphate GlcNAc-1-phosphate transferase
MVTRISSGRSPFAADKNHFHHNLMALGFLHPESVFIIYLFQTFLLLAAVHFRYYSDWGLLAGYLVFSALVLYGFSHASRTSRQVRRFVFLDAKVAGRLRLLRRDGALIKYSFRLFETGVPLLLFLTCLVAERAHPRLRLASLACAALVALVALARSAWLPGLLRFVFYLLIPFSVYLSGDRVTLLGDLLPMRAYSASFGAVAVLIILISKFSRRKSGFRSTPMDFLIIILALVIPNLPEQKIQEYQIGLVAAKILLLYFSFEVLQSEMRGKMYGLALWTVASLVAFSC